MGWEYVIPGYVAAAIALGGYAVHVVRRGRLLSQRVPARRRRYVQE